ncbi:ATPase family AAA domain-containing protein FIGL1-like [Cornus florida]|uniref:ATPase family AAA domain-containing protein FIGL1-like n=1 Tax=Cornus florida TaxID=4283 RepID=UPI00289F5BA4|nr:ATPase family AAA domain-containing protein FIGL1-like [Cornus florida]
MEEDTEVCWRKEVDTNLKCLQLHLFGADIAFRIGYFNSAQILALCLVGFLDSHSHTDIDDAFIRPIQEGSLKLKFDAAFNSSRKSCDGGLILRDHFGQPIKVSSFFLSNVRSPSIAEGLIFRECMSLLRLSGYHNVIVEGDYQPVMHLQANAEAIFSSVSCISTVELMADEGGGGNPTGGKDRHGEALSKVKFDNFQRETKQALQDIQANFQRETKQALADIQAAIMLGPNQNPNNKRLRDEDIEVKGIKSDEDLAKGIKSEYEEDYRRETKEREDKRAKNLKQLELVRSSKCQAFAQADKDTGYIDIDEIKQSKDSQKSKRTTLENQPNRKDKTSKVDGNGSATARAKLERVARNRGYGLRSKGVQQPGIRDNKTSFVGGTDYNTLDDSTKRCLETLCGPKGEIPEKLRNLEPHHIEQVTNEIMERDPNVRWDDIAGLEHAKKSVTEMVIWPLLRPDIFKGCRSPGKGLLLFGPPGTGKTMIGKAIAGEAKATFFYISSSSLASKWFGESEKLVRALFGVACCRQPAVIFVDEIDSLLSKRKSGEHDAYRRFKTQFLTEMEGFDSGSEQILLIGATNRPQDLDEAARRRLTKRLYIPLPSSDARAWIIHNLLEKDVLFKLSKEDIDKICELTEGYSGSDMKNLVKDASMGPLREALKQGIEITKLKQEDMRPVNLEDFESAFLEVSPSVSLDEIGAYEEWNQKFGSLSL